jgi:hypothetical protein
LALPGQANGAGRQVASSVQLPQCPEARDRPAQAREAYERAPALAQDEAERRLAGLGAYIGV